MWRFFYGARGEDFHSKLERTSRGLKRAAKQRLRNPLLTLTSLDHLQPSSGPIFKTRASGCIHDLEKLSFDFRHILILNVSFPTTRNKRFQFQGVLHHKSDDGIGDGIHNVICGELKRLPKLSHTLLVIIIQGR